MDATILERLKQIVGAAYVCSRRSDTEVYSYDASLTFGAPDVVVLPADAEQIAAVARVAAEARLPCIARGFGTNLSGGSIAPRGGIVLQLSRLNRILAIRPEGRYAVVQPGVTNLELQNAVAPLGFYYAPDPASQKAATLGGNAAENAGGPHCLKYGVTTNHVLGMTVVLPGGEVVRVGGPALDPPGYDVRGVLIGSEGTLGIITEMVVRILPAAESLLTMLAVYDDVAAAARSVSAITAAGIVPATLEMMDAPAIRAIEASKPSGYPLDAAAVLIAEVDGPAAGLAEQADRVRRLCMENGCREVRAAKNLAERNALWAGRRGAFGALARLAPSFLVADCTVPRTLLPEALAKVAAIAARYQLGHANVFHAGDGNLHPVLLFDPRNAELVERVHHAGREIMEACVGLGGTITGEHGVGVEKMDAMELVLSPDDMDFQRRLRAAFDPQELMNPGKVLPPPNGTPPADETTDRVLPPDGELVPGDVREACEIVRSAYHQRRTIVPCGPDSQPDDGHGTIPLRSTKLTAVTEHDPANQVIAAQAGRSLESLQEVLAQGGQWLPVRPPRASRWTLGGLAASGACGPERLRYGAPRDLLLGLKFVSGTGRLISAGGRVVKNVAGYDVTRLLAGSAGTLGFLVELTFRVLPLPQSCLAVTGLGSLAQCGAAAAGLLKSKLEPNLVVAVPEGPALQILDRGTWRLIAGFEGFEETVRFQVEAGQALLRQAGLNVSAVQAYAPREGACSGFFDALYEHPFVLRADLPPDRVAEYLADHAELVRGAAVLADFGCGRITASLSTLTDAGWEQWCDVTSRAEGTVVQEQSPEAFRQRHDVCGRPRPDWPLFRKIKAALDPGGVFPLAGFLGRQ